MNGPVVIRPETPSDEDRIRAINEAAFEGPGEARLVEGLRGRVEPLVSLVAEQEGQPVGHILFSPVILEGHEEALLMGVGPMAVLPSRQRRGIGSHLVRAGIERCRALGAQALVVLGHPDYYPRFGFRPAAEWGLGSEFEAPEEAFLALELQPGWLSRASGTVRYHPAFSGL